MAEPKGKFVKLATEDRSRMSRLYEETLSRIREMELIISRNLNKTMSPSAEGFRILPPSQAKLLADEEEEEEKVLVVITVL
jgi:hypothetical protein